MEGIHNKEIRSVNQVFDTIFSVENKQ